MENWRKRFDIGDLFKELSLASRADHAMMFLYVSEVPVAIFFPINNW